ncbi:TetR/AcrR family transcriptional regulator [Marimonas lutisalis]|uniref:TetR/AcrR family transcriptional regulator n=1 Tax=Marimonas lutisalis TaxID=2545756 RepID=UPI0010F8EFA3|nr:TetR/AcrR family transcriptional regulator [Marimonas lutisalis]
MKAPTRKANPRKTAKDKRREETRARLLSAARQLFSDYGYDAVSVTEIAREAGVTHGMINVYFGGKPGLLYEIVRETNGSQYEETMKLAEGPGPAFDRLGAVLLFWVEGDTADPRLLAVMHSYSWVWPDETEADNRTVRDMFTGALQQIVADGQERGEFNRALDAGTAARAIWAIYTWGVRAAIFDQATALDCHRTIMAQVNLVLDRT